MRKESGSSYHKSGKSSGPRKDDGRKPYGGKGRSFDKPERSDKPYGKKEGQGEGKSYGERGERPGRFEGNDRPRKSFGKEGFDRGEGGYKKPFNREERGEGGFKKSFNKEGRGEGGFKKPFNREDRGEGGYKKPFNREERGEGGYKKPFNREERGEGGYKKSFSRDGRKEEGYKKPFNREERGEGGYKKPFNREERGEGGYKKSFNKEGRGEGGFKKSFNREERGEGGFKKPFNREERGEGGYKKSFNREERGEGGYKKSFNREERGEGGYKKPFNREERGEGGHKKSFNRDEKGFDKKKPFNKNDKFADKKAGKPKFEEQDIFGKNDRKKRKEDDENFILNENEGFTKELEDKYAPERKTFYKPKPVTKKKYEEEDEEDDEDDFVDEKEAKRYRNYGNVDQEGPMPLNKYVAHSGECSRRDAAEMIKQGKVRVNGELMLEPGYRVNPEDQVTIGGKKLKPTRNYAYLLLNKPKGFITTTEDPEGRKTVMELVDNAGVDRLFPVGRLDRNTTGLLLLTNDGDLAQKLSHPSHEVKKIYQVTLDKNLTKVDFEKILAGVQLEDGLAPVDALSYLESKNELGLEIHSGRNRIVRRIFESLGYVVEKLDRVMYAGLTKKNIPRGSWRFLTEREIILLKHFKN